MNSQQTGFTMPVDGSYRLDLPDGGRVEVAATWHPPGASSVVDSSPMLLGASNLNGPLAVAEYESRFGPLRVRRSYDSWMPEDYMAGRAASDVDVRHSVWSFKPDLRTGVDRGALERLAGSIPETPYTKVAIIGHELEPAINEGRWTPADMRGVAIAWHDAVAALGRSDVRPAVCFAGTQTFRKANGYGPDEVCPSAHETPLLIPVFDGYNRWPAPTGDAGEVFAWETFEDRFHRQIQWARLAGYEEWVVGETSCHESYTDVYDRGHPDGYVWEAKVDWMAEALRWAEVNGCLFFCYWDRPFAGGQDLHPDARRLWSSVTFAAAWRAFNQLYTDAE